MVRVVLTKLSDARHRLAVVRDGRATEEAELETRSYLLHDLTHHAVEAELGIEDGFYGLLARGTNLEELADRTRVLSQGLARAESVVGPLTSVWNERLDRARFAELSGLEDAVVGRMLERLRQLAGEWRAVRYREAMTLRWPP